MTRYRATYRPPARRRLRLTLRGYNVLVWSWAALGLLLLWGMGGLEG